ncbi:MAG: hypothetical protein ACRCXF_03060, partial [Plesiomonas shigelloides]
EAATVLATFAHPQSYRWHSVCLCTWGFTHMPSTCNAKSFGYSQGIQLTDNAGQKFGKEAVSKAE